MGIVDFRRGSRGEGGGGCIVRFWRREGEGRSKGVKWGENR